jgi:hypothetical protein
MAPDLVSRLAADIITGEIAGRPLPKLTLTQGEELRHRLLEQISWSREWGDDKDGPAGEIMLKARLDESLRNEEIRLAREKVDRETAYVFTADGGGGVKDFSVFCKDRTAVAVSGLSDTSALEVYGILGDMVRKRGVVPAVELPASEAIDASWPRLPDSVSSAESSDSVVEQTAAEFHAALEHQHPEPEIAPEPEAKLTKAEAHIAHLQTLVKTPPRKPHQPRAQLSYHIVLLLFICLLPWTFPFFSHWILALLDALWECAPAVKQYGGWAVWVFLNFLGYYAKSYVLWLRGGRGELVATPVLG